MHNDCYGYFTSLRSLACFRTLQLHSKPLRLTAQGMATAAPPKCTNAPTGRGGGYSRGRVPMSKERLLASGSTLGELTYR
jgi:hypothetical protein